MLVKKCVFCSKILSIFCGIFCGNPRIM
jgi:hypothetical protein